MRKHCHRERLSVTTGLRTNDLLDIRHERGQLCATFKHHRQHQRRHQRQLDCFHVNQTVSIIIVVITSIPFHKVISVRPYQLREELHPTTVTHTHTHTRVCTQTFHGADRWVITPAPVPYLHSSGRLASAGGL